MGRHGNFVRQESQRDERLCVTFSTGSLIVLLLRILIDHE